jgi:hypothetical protein
MVASLRFWFWMLLALAPAARADTVRFSDRFDRSDADPAREDPGHGWGTNSKARAQGQKQVWLRDGAMFIKMAPVADHGVSVTQDLAFRDAVIRMRFRLGNGDDLGINVADMNEKSVHAGHICMPRIRLDSLEITDLKTGRMRLDVRERSLAKALTAEDKALLAATTARFPLQLEADVWHDLEVRIEGTVLTVKIDGREAGSLRSEGIGHPTKSRIRLAVNREAWVDDVEVTAPGGAENR